MRRPFLPMALAASMLSLSSPVLANTYTVVIDANATWTQAQAAAQFAGGYLAVITTAAEQAAVEAAIAADSPPRDGGFWIGLIEAGECCYVWAGVAGHNCYANFYAGEPNNGAGNTPEDRGQIMWNLSNPSRRGPWNDVPDAGLAGALDISRLGYVIEFGPHEPVPTCGQCLPVSPASFCNRPPPNSTVVTTKVTGTSTTSGKNSRTITDISQPPAGPSWLHPARIQATYMVSLTVASAGVSASAVAAALIDSINHQIGPSGFVASYTSLTSDTVQMYRPAGGYVSSDNNGIPGITLTSQTYVVPTPAAAGPSLTGWGTGGLMLLLLILGGGALRWRRRTHTADSSPHS